MQCLSYLAMLLWTAYKQPNPLFGVLLSIFLIVHLYHVGFSPFSAPMQNFIQIGQKIRKLEIFTFGRFWLVGLVGRKMVAATSNIQLLPGRL